MKRAIGRAEEVSFEFGVLIADMKGREFQMKGPATVNDLRLNTRRMPGTTYFPADGG